MMKRKIMAAFLSSLLVNGIYCVIYSQSFENFIAFYFLSLLIVMTYGTAMSIMSDWIVTKLFEEKKKQEMVSFIAHILFGFLFIFILSSFSISIFLTIIINFFTLICLLLAIFFFIADRWLKKVNISWWAIVFSATIITIAITITGGSITL